MTKPCSSGALTLSKLTLMEARFGGITDAASMEFAKIASGERRPSVRNQTF